MSDYIQTSLPAACGVAAFQPGAVLGPRVLKCFEFVWLLEGEALHESGGVATPVPEQSVLLLRPGVAHTLRWDAWNRTRHAYLPFSVKELPLDGADPRTWPLLRAPAENDILRTQFRYLLNWYGRGRPELTRLTLQHILASFITGESATEEQAPSEEPSTVERALTFIQQRMDQDPAIPLHLPQLAKAAGVSQEHLCRAFTRVTGRSPAETVRLARLDRAATLLSRTNMAVQDVAHLCGFASAFHFSRRFSAAFGQAPRRFRTLISAGAPPPVPLLARDAKQAGRRTKGGATPRRALYLKFLSTAVE
jgi:AraC family transcriptional regulator